MVVDVIQMSSDTQFKGMGKFGGSFFWGGGGISGSKTSVDYGSGSVSGQTADGIGWVRAELSFNRILCKPFTAEPCHQAPK